MKKKSFIFVLGLAFMAFIAISAFKLDDKPVPPSNKNCCPPGWMMACQGTTGGTWYSHNGAKRDKNNDGCLCYKNLPGNNANGNNLGPAAARNWKDNTSACK